MLLYDLTEDSVLLKTFSVKPLYVLDITIAAGSGIPQHPRTLHTYIMNSVIHTEVYLL